MALCRCQLVHAKLCERTEVLAVAAGVILVQVNHFLFDAVVMMMMMIVGECVASAAAAVVGVVVMMMMMLMAATASWKDVRRTHLRQQTYLLLEWACPLLHLHLEILVLLEHSAHHPATVLLETAETWIIYQTCNKHQAIPKPAFLSSSPPLLLMVQALLRDGLSSPIRYSLWNLEAIWRLSGLTYKCLWDSCYLGSVWVNV